MRIQPKPKRSHSIAVALLLTIFALLLSSCDQEAELAKEDKQGCIIDEDMVISQTDVDGYIVRDSW